MEKLPFRFSSLTEEIVKRAEEELGETKETRENAIIEMRKHIEDNLGVDCADDFYILVFLRVRKFNVERAVNLFKSYFSSRASRKDIYLKGNFENVRKICSDQLLMVAPLRDEKGAAVLIFQPKNWNVGEMDFGSLVHAATWLIVCSLMYSINQICGMRLIFDLGGLTFNHLYHMNPRTLALLAQNVSNASPLRLRGVHVVNEPFIFKPTWDLIKPLMSDKLRKRVHFHSTNLESLHEIIRPEILPEDILGGTCPYDNEFWSNILEDLKPMYDTLLSYEYEIKKRS